MLHNELLIFLKKVLHSPPKTEGERDVNPHGES